MRSQRTNGNPIIVGGGKVRTLSRLVFTERHFDEGFISERIRENPSMLPVSEVDAVFAPAISIGREVSTNAGSIDNLMVSPSGYITLVETKLWRNPEARREVVGQIIDYAKELTRWSFTDLNERVKAYNQKYRGKRMGLMELLREEDMLDASDETALVDIITRNMKQGRFLLLVAGDGIRESVEELADFMQSYPNLHFTLALVELQMYPMTDNGANEWLVVPQVVTRTKEIVRAIVRVEGVPAGIATSSDTTHVSVSVSDEESHTRNLASDNKRYTISHDAFNESLAKYVGADGISFSNQVIEEVGELGCIVEWKQGSYVVKYPDPSGSGARLTLFVVARDGFFYLGWLPYQLERAKLNPKLGFDYVRNVAAVFPDCNVNERDNTTLSRMIRLSELQEHWAEVRGLLATLIADTQADARR